MPKIKFTNFFSNFELLQTSHLRYKNANFRTRTKFECISTCHGCSKQQRRRHLAFGGVLQPGLLSNSPRKSFGDPAEEGMNYGGEEWAADGRIIFRVPTWTVLVRSTIPQSGKNRQMSRIGRISPHGTVEPTKNWLVIKCQWFLSYTSFGIHILTCGMAWHDFCRVHMDSEGSEPKVELILYICEHGCLWNLHSDFSPFRSMPHSDEALDNTHAAPLDHIPGIKVSSSPPRTRQFH